MAERSESSLLKAALAYAANGFWVFPTHDIAAGSCSCGRDCPSPGKHPRTPNGFKDATTDPATIARWWAQYPAANIAIDCGRSGIIVADVDVKRGAQGEAVMRWFLERSPAFQETYLVTTPSGGYHFYFHGRWAGNKKAFGAGVDMQGDGAYVLAPPSVAFGQYDAAGQPMPGSGRAYSVARSAPLVAFPRDLRPDPAVPEDEYDFSGRVAESERAAVPYGEHRQALLWLGWHLRSVHGLTVEAGLPIMRDFLKVLDNYNPAAPFSDRILRSMLVDVRPNVAKASPPTTGASLADSIVPASVVLSVPQVVRQTFIPGLIVQGALHVFYGESGVGKSTIVAAELAEISRQGRDVLVFINEDRPYDFDIKYHLAGGDLRRLFNQRDDMATLSLPKNLKELEQVLASRPWGAVYFDSIHDMSTNDTRLNASQSARALFGPLHVLAERYNLAIICTHHTNKGGVYEGSAQIRAKSRVFARVARPKNDPSAAEYDFAQDESWTTIVTTEKFQRGKSGARYAFHFEVKPSMNPYTGKIDRELDEKGVEHDVMQYVCTGFDPIAYEAKTDEPAQHRPSTTSVEHELRAKIEALWRSDPTISGRKIAETIGGRNSDIYRILRELKGEKSA